MRRPADRAEKPFLILIDAIRTSIIQPSMRMVCRARGHMERGNRNNIVVNIHCMHIPKYTWTPGPEPEPEYTSQTATLEKMRAVLCCRGACSVLSVLSFADVIKNCMRWDGSVRLAVCARKIHTETEHISTQPVTHMRNAKATFEKQSKKPKTDVS